MSNLLLMQNQPHHLFLLFKDHQLLGAYSYHNLISKLNCDFAIERRLYEVQNTFKAFVRFYNNEHYSVEAVSHVYQKDNLVYYKPDLTLLDHLKMLQQAFAAPLNLSHNCVTLPDYTKAKHQPAKMYAHSHAGQTLDHEYKQHKMHLQAAISYDLKRREVVSDIQNDYGSVLTHCNRQTSKYLDLWDDYDDIRARRSFGWKETHRLHQYKNKDSH